MVEVFGDFRESTHDIIGWLDENQIPFRFHNTVLANNSTDGKINKFTVPMVYHNNQSCGKTLEEIKEYLTIHGGKN